jgi:hypothetical protein
MTNIFKKFNEDFFSKCNRTIKWYDEQGVFRTTDGLVTITIDDVGTHNNYNGYWVEKINPRVGTIVKKFFRFSDHLTMVHRNERDKHSHVWLNNGTFEWYISKPKDTKEMTDVMFDWIDNFITLP